MIKKYYVIEKVVNPFTAVMLMSFCQKEDFCVVESEEVAKDYCKKHSPQYILYKTKYKYTYEEKLKKLSLDTSVVDNS